MMLGEHSVHQRSFLPRGTESPSRKGDLSSRTMHIKSRRTEAPGVRILTCALDSHLNEAKGLSVQ